VPRNLSSVMRGQGPVAAVGSTGGDAVPAAPSFLQALMAGGGVIHPPNGPPIPLNVDFGSEVQLGRLLGRGGFGHVYEASWRGQQVRQQHGSRWSSSCAEHWPHSADCQLFISCACHQLHSCLQDTASHHSNGCMCLTVCDSLCITACTNCWPIAPAQAQYAHQQQTKL
jgi:hypothetical protein